MSGKLPAVLSSADVYNMKVRRGGNTLHSCWLIIKWALRTALPQTAAFISHVYFWDQIQKLQWKKKNVSKQKVIWNLSNTLSHFMSFFTTSRKKIMFSHFFDHYSQQIFCRFSTWMIIQWDVSEFHVYWILNDDGSAYLWQLQTYNIPGVFLTLVRSTTGIRSPSWLFSLCLLCMGSQRNKKKKRRKLYDD